MKLKVKLDDDAFIPARAHESDAGYDIKSPIKTRLYAGQSVSIDTGVHVQIPKGYAGFLKSKDLEDTERGDNGFGSTGR